MPNVDLDKEKLKDIADIPDDTGSGDPISIAMMKLEGTYKTNDDDNKTHEDSSSVQDLIKEVEMLNLKKLPTFPKSPLEKRKSLMIERRRQTIMNIPFTPQNSEEGLAIEDKCVSPLQVQTLSLIHIFTRRPIRENFFTIQR